MMSILLITRQQAVGLGWFVSVLVILAVVACSCKIKSLLKDHRDDNNKVDPPLSN